MEYHFSEHMNNIHDIFLHGALNLNLHCVIWTGYKSLKKKIKTKKTHKKKQTRWCKEEVERGKKDYLQN